MTPRGFCRKCGERDRDRVREWLATIGTTSKNGDRDSPILVAGSPDSHSFSRKPTYQAGIVKLIHLGVGEIVLVDGKELAGAFLIVPGLLQQGFDAGQVSLLAINGGSVALDGRRQQARVNEGEH